MAVLLTAVIAGDGRSNWFKGIQLITLYLLIALLFYFIPRNLILYMEDKVFWEKLIYRKGAILDPVTRLSEVVFGLIMVLTFTGSVSIATSGRDDIRTMLMVCTGL